MNGRIYDATLARFMSADPHIQEGALTQSYNRYSYVMNNPLKYSDPSGYFFKKLFRAVRKAVKRVTKVVKKVAKLYDRVRRELFWKPLKKTLQAIAKVPVLNAIVGAAACYFTAGLGCALYSAVSTYAVTGSLSTALKSGVSAAIMQRAGSFKGDWLLRGIKKGIAAGVSSKLMGGKFKDGFKVAFVTSSAQSLYKHVSSKYNPSGKPHLWQKGQSDVGSQLDEKVLARVTNGEITAPLSSDQSVFMKTVGRGPLMDAFAEFHDGLHDYGFIPDDQVSLIVTMPPSYALTAVAATEPYTHLYVKEKSRRRHRE
jgi:hypothetical protein